MPFSTYDVTVPVYRRLLAALSAILDKAAAYAVEKDVEPEVLITARLYPDMFSLAEQVWATTNHAVRGTGRLAGIPLPTYTGPDDTFADLKARIAWALAHLEPLEAKQFEGADAKTIVFPAGDQERRMSGSDYLLAFSLPNFYFHLSMAYAILRHNGVPLGKDDFVG
ncbi:MAG TPA: DUF1993 domain-containing protein [Bauldia sp.]|nr:DUF1993 domain-containing protein [Bauldia sp.]